MNSALAPVGSLRVVTSVPALVGSVRKKENQSGTGSRRKLVRLGVDAGAAEAAGESVSSLLEGRRAAEIQKALAVTTFWMSGDCVVGSRKVTGIVTLWMYKNIREMADCSYLDVKYGWLLFWNVHQRDYRTTSTEFSE